MATETAPVQGIGIRRNGLINVMSNADIQRQDQAEEAKRSAEREQNKPALINLASHIEKKWQNAKLGKIEVETRLLKCARQRKGKYEPDVAAKIAARGGSDIFMMITAAQCRAGEAWIKDVMMRPGEKPWSFDPTPYPDLPGDIEEQIEDVVTMEAVQMMTMSRSIEAVSVEQIENRIRELRDLVMKEQTETARHICKQQELRIEDDFQEGDFYKSLDAFINDLVTFPTAFLKGPILRTKPKLQWDYDEDNKPIPVVKKIVSKEYSRVSPFDLYFASGAKNIQDGYLIERIRMRRHELESMKGVPGYNEKAIDGALVTYQDGGLRDWLWTDQQRNELEDKPQALTDTEPLIDGLVYWGHASGAMLRQWGMTPKQVPTVTGDYQVCAILIGRWVIMAQINPHPLGHRPYYAASYEEVNDSIWGRSIPELLEDNQRMCNAAARSLVNNMAIASGPQVEVHKDRLEPGEDVEDIYPWKITKTTSDERGGRDSPAMYFYQPDDNSKALMKVYQYWFDQASEVTGIPRYMYGSEKIGSGAGKTASGLSMLMNAASKSLKNVIFHIDNGVTKPVIYAHWLHLMLYDDTMEKGGDINILARASEYLIMQEQLQVRLTEMLTFTDNPTDLAIMGYPGRGEMLREAIKSLKLPDVNKIVPPREVLEARFGGGMEQPGMPVMPMPGQQIPGQPANLLPGGQPAGGVQPAMAPQAQRRAA